MWQIDDRVTCWDVLEFVKGIHSISMDFVDGNLAERIKRFGEYVLKKVEISELRRGIYNLDHDLIKEYAMESLETLPPIVLGEKYHGKYEVIDGNHRVEACVLRNCGTVLAFVPVWNTKIMDAEDDEC